MINDIKISFIITVYNIETYVKRCLDSVLMQNINEKEIIIVDDGSIDSCPDICDQYAHKYSNVKVIHKSNGGISSARNLGIYEAHGDYICFVDGDDFYRNDFAENMLNLCYENDLDIIRGWYSVYEDKSNTFSEHKFPKISFEGQTLSGHAFLVKSIKEHANEVVPWLGFFKRKFLLDNNILFPEGIAYEEDQLFFLDALLRDPNCRVLQVNNEFYAYRKHVGSATKTPTIKQIEDVLCIVDEEFKILNKYDFISKKTKKSAKRYISSSFYQLTSIYGRLTKENRKKINHLISFCTANKCIKNSYDLHQKIKIFLFTYCRWFVGLIYDLRGKK